MAEDILVTREAPHEDIRTLCAPLQRAQDAWRRRTQWLSVLVALCLLSAIVVTCLSSQWRGPAVLLCLTVGLLAAAMGADAQHTKARLAQRHAEEQWIEDNCDG